nr:hypothetical protein Iba_chr02dCG0090 [Ipomoea batatas]
MEATVDENDLPKLLGVLPAEVPDSRPPPYTEDVADQAAKQVVEQQQQRRLEESKPENRLDCAPYSHNPMTGVSRSDALLPSPNDRANEKQFRCVRFLLEKAHSVEEPTKALPDPPRYPVISFIAPKSLQPAEKPQSTDSFREAKTTNSAIASRVRLESDEIDGSSTWRVQKSTRSYRNSIVGLEGAGVIELNGSAERK